MPGGSEAMKMFHVSIGVLLLLLLLLVLVPAACAAYRSKKSNAKKTD
jgi:cytochrome b561